MSNSLPYIMKGMDVKELEPRSIEESELPTLIAFLNDSLRGAYNWSIDQEYPQVFNKTSLPYLRVIEKEGKILSHAAWRPIIIKTEMGIFKVAVIGSVVTDSNYRKQGLSRKIMESILVEARACGCEFSILWSDKTDFYQQFGFSLSGSEKTAIIDKKLMTTPSQLKILDTNQVSAESIHRLYQKHTVSSVRNALEVEKYLNIPNSKVYTAWQGNELKAYMVEGKGADFDSYIHEWAGDIPALKILVNHILQEQQRKIHWMIPAHSVNLLETLKSEQIFVHEGYLGLIKILNFHSIAAKITRFAKGHLRFTDFYMEERDEKYYLGFGPRALEFHQLEDLTMLVFGPQYPSEIPAIDTNMAKQLDLIFPIKMWIWGWDSI